MTEPTAEETEALRIATFADDVRSLDARAFREKHGDGFLLHFGLLHAERKPKRPQRTVVLTEESSKVGFLPKAADPGPDILVFPVKWTGRSPYPRIITVGRTKNNDIVLADEAISKFHALFKEEQEMFFLQDADSRNGTFVDGQAVPSTKTGKPVELRGGAKIKFGIVELQFVRGAEFREMVKRAAK